MSKHRPDQGEDRSSVNEGVASPGLRPLRGLRSYLHDLWAARSDPTIPAGTPILHDYPIRRSSSATPWSTP
jgi:hypothetical protein